MKIQFRNGVATESLIKILESSNTDIQEGIFDIFKSREEKAGIKARKDAEKINKEKLQKRNTEFIKTGKESGPLEGVDTEKVAAKASIDVIMSDAHKEFNRVFEKFANRLEKMFGPKVDKYPEEAKTAIGLIGRAMQELEDYNKGRE